MMKNEHDKHTEALDRVVDGYQEIIESDTVELDTFLTTNCINADEAVLRAWEASRRQLLIKKAEESKSKFKTELAIVKKLQEKVIKAPQATLEAIEAIFKRKALSVQFNKLEEWNEESIQEVFEDIELLELLEQIDSDK